MRKPPSPHGTHSRYSKGCRCEPCRLGHREYERNQSRVRRREEQGIEMRPQTHVDVTEAREHLIFLRSKGVGLVQISKKTGLSKNYIQMVCRGEISKMAIKTSEKILALPAIHELPGQYVPAKEAKRLARELIKAGVTKTEIARFIGGPKTHNLVIRNKIRLRRLQRLQALHKSVIRK